MAETAAFIYDPSAMESLKTDLNKIRTEAQASLKELQAQKTLAESTLAEAESTYNKELAVYEAAMVKYRAALAAYEEAMKSYESAMESFTEAMKNYKPPEPPNPCPRGWTPPSPPSPPTPPTAPVEPTPPSPDAMNAAKAALAAVNESIAQVQSDIECLNTLVDTITNINKQVTESDKEAVHLLTNDFFKLWEFSGMNATGNDVANAIVNNAKAVKDGYDYIDTKDGRLYLDLFDDEKLSMPQYIKLGETIGTTALVVLMQQKGWGAEAIYHAAHTIDSSIDYNQVKGMYNDFANTNRQSPVHSDKSSTAQINNVLSAYDEDVTLLVDGVAGPIVPNDYTKPRITTNSKGLQENTPLTSSLGRVWGPAGEETFYNLEMRGVVSIMRGLGFDEQNYPYWVRDDGVKMLGDYVIVAADLDIRPRGSLIDTSVGKGLVCDTGGFIYSNSEQLDIATTW